MYPSMKLPRPLYCNEFQQCKLQKKRLELLEPSESIWIVSQEHALPRMPLEELSIAS